MSNPTPIRPLDPEKLLRELESDIRVERESSRRFNVAIYFTAGDCLRRIRDEKLYKARNHRTFGGYLRKRWRMSDEEAEWIMNVTSESQRLMVAIRKFNESETGPHAIEKTADE